MAAAKEVDTAKRSRAIRRAAEEGDRRRPVIFMFQPTIQVARRAKRRATIPASSKTCTSSAPSRKSYALSDRPTGSAIRRSRRAGVGPRLGSGQVPGQSGGEQPAFRRAHLPRAYLRHLLHRPGDPDRSGAGHCRRQGLGRDLCTGAGRDRARPAAARAVLALSDEGAARRFRHFRITSQPVLQDMLQVFPATLELATAGHCSSAWWSACRWAWWPPPIAAAGGPGGPRRRPARLFHAGVLARAWSACCCSTPGSAGSRGRAGSTWSSTTSSPRHRHDHHRQPASPANAKSSGTRFSHLCCRPPSSAISRWPISRA